MKKILIIIICAFTIVIGLNYFIKNKNDYYRNIADLVISFYDDDRYDKNIVKDKDKEAIDEFLSKLTHKNEIISLEDYIIKSEDFYTSSANTPGVYKKDGKCYIKYEDLEFHKFKNIDIEMEAYKNIVCDHYFVELYESQFYPDYSVTKANPKYDYVFEKYKEVDNGYEYTYYSTYDSSKIKIILILDDKVLIKVDTKFIDRGDY